jgi:hypothetical protein
VPSTRIGKYYCVSLSGLDEEFVRGVIRVIIWFEDLSRDRRDNVLVTGRVSSVSSST